jgi:hypothetical protein
MSPEWSFKNRAWIVARLVFRGHTDVVAEEATDKALVELEQRVQASGWQFRGERHFCSVWLKRARHRAADILRRGRRRPRARPAGLAHEWRTVYQGCLERLGDIPRRILEMYYWEGLRDPAIGRALWPDEPASATTSRANRVRHEAQAALRQELLQAGLDARTLDFDYGPLGRLRRRHPEQS